VNTYEVTFTNANSVSDGEEPTALNVTVVSAIEPDDVIADGEVSDIIARLAMNMWDAVAAADPTWLWDDVDWASDDPGWEAALLHLPDGQVIDLMRA